MDADDIKRLADAARRAKANAQPIETGNDQPSERELRRRELQRKHAQAARQALRGERP